MRSRWIGWPAAGLLALTVVLLPGLAEAKRVEKDIASIPAAREIVVRGFSGIVRLQSHASIPGLEGAVRVHAEGEAEVVGAMDAEEDQRSQTLTVTAQPRRGFFRKKVFENCKVTRDLAKVDTLTILVPAQEPVRLRLDETDAYLDLATFPGALEVDGGGVAGRVRDLDMLSLQTEIGCGLSVGRVARAAVLEVAGEGSLEIAEVAGDLTLNTTRQAGKIEIRRLFARFDGRMDGGEVDIAEGRASTFHLNVGGRALFAFGGTAVAPRVEISDRGRVRIGACEGLTADSPQNAASDVCGR